MTEYRYQEYPKCLYRGNDTITVCSLEEESAAIGEGWITAHTFFGYGNPPKSTEEPAKKKRGK